MLPYILAACSAFNCKLYIKAVLRLKLDCLYASSGPLMEQILHRIPDMEYAEIRQFVNGPESFTSDLQPLLGETAEVCVDRWMCACQ